VRRRDVLATLAGVGTAATAGCGILGDFDAGGDRPPITVETIDAPGSEAGTVDVPAPDRVTFVAFFATTCTACAEEMPALAEAHDAVDDDVLFLSVTSEPVGATISRAELADWWAGHGGDWPVGLDDGTALAQRYDATRLPKQVVLDTDGAVAWRHGGRASAATIVDGIRAVRGGDRS